MKRLLLVPTFCLSPGVALAQTTYTVARPVSQGGQGQWAPPPARKMNHEGFALRMGLGFGSGSVSGDLSNERTKLDESISGSGPAFELFLGGGLSRGLALGFDLHGQILDKPRVKLGAFEGTATRKVTMSLAGIGLMYFPNPDAGLHLGGTLGLGRASFQDRDSNAQFTVGGPGIGGHVGYDFSVSPTWALGVNARMSYLSLKRSERAAEETFSGPAFSVLFSACNF